MYIRFMWIGAFFITLALLDVSGINVPQLAQVEPGVEQVINTVIETLPSPLPPNGSFFEEDELESNEFFIDPRQIDDAKRQIKDLLRRIKEVNKQAKKYGSASDIEILNTVGAELTKFRDILNSGDMDAISENIHDFWDANYWQQIDEVDRRIRLPKEIADMNKAIKRVEKLLTARKKALQTVNTVLGLNTGIFAELITNIKGVVSEADRLLRAGELEDASETLNEIHSGGLHPGGIEGMVHELTSLAGNVKRIKNPDIIAKIKALIAEPFNLVIEGDLQGAHEAYNDVRNDIYRLIQQGTARAKRSPSQ